MKIFITIITLLITLNLQLSASDMTKTQEKSYDFFGLVFFPGIPTSSNDTDIAGIRVGLPVAGGKNQVIGLEFAALCCMTEKLYGIQTAPILCMSKHLRGVQASPVNISDKVIGLQFGIFNACKNATFQIGILNYNKSAIIPFLPIINWNF